MENTNIEWCHHTVNFWWGCAKVHTGCKNCYAEHLSEKRYKNGVWGEKANRKRIKSAFPTLDKIQKSAKRKGVFETVFVGSMMDIFEESKDLIQGNVRVLTKTGDRATTHHLRKELFSRIDGGMYSNLIFLFLTKRPENIDKMIPKRWLVETPPNVWFGTSVSNQKTAEDLIPKLIGSGSAHSKLFLSVEPQVGRIDLEAVKMDVCGCSIKAVTLIDWVIQGGESGTNKRPFDLEWAKLMRDQCESMFVPYFFKQIDKVQPIPSDLLVRQFPSDFNPKTEEKR